MTIINERAFSDAMGKRAASLLKARNSTPTQLAEMQRNALGEGAAR
jgi:hypothetical protein